MKPGYRLVILCAATFAACSTATAAPATATPLFPAPSLRFDVTPMPYAVATGDLNGDGIPDLVVAGVDYASVLLGRGDGTFANAVNYPIGGANYGRSPADGLALGDLNGDGKLDLVSADAGESSMSVLLGHGDGTFAPRSIVPTAISSHGVALGDLDGDGKLDAVTANNDSTISVLRGVGDGSFLPPVGLAIGAKVNSVAIGDFNADGKLDVAAAKVGSGIAVLLGQGDGTFGAAVSYATAHSPVFLATADINGDGKPDLAATDDYGNVSVLPGHGDGTFGAEILSAAGARQSLAVGDFNGDGKLDVVVGDIAGFYDYAGVRTRVMLGHGDGTFAPPVILPSGPDPGAVAVADFNGDGHADIVAASRTYGSQSEGQWPNHTVSVFLGNGDGTFGTWRHYPLAGQSSGVAIADMNADGRPDVVCLDGSVSVFLGTGDGTLGPRVDYAAPLAPLQREPTLLVRDLNGDGRPDVVALGQSSVVVLLGQSGGTLGPAATFPVGGGARAIAIGDLDGDGFPDIVTADGDFAGTLSLLKGLGDGSFAPYTSIPASINFPGSIAVGDLNGDGRMDIVTASDDRSQVSVILGQGAGAFGPPATYDCRPGVHSIQLADLDGDGVLDVVGVIPDACPTCTGAYIPGSDVVVMKGLGDGTLAAFQQWTTGFVPQGLAIGDLDGDGKLDVATSDAVEGALSVLSGHGNGIFDPAQGFGGLGAGFLPPYSDYYGPAFTALGDLNGDGRLDAVLTQLTQLTVFISTLPSGIVAVGVGGLQAVPREGSVELRWSAFVDARAKLRVLRSNSQSGNYELIGEELTVAPDRSAYSFIDKTAHPGAVYFYKIAYQDGAAWRYAGPVRVELPAAVFALRAARPNPSRGTCELSYELARAGTCHLALYDLSGRLVRTLVSGIAPAGEGVSRWDGRDESGRPAPDGIYFARLSSGGAARSQRLVLMK